MNACTQIHKLLEIAVEDPSVAALVGAAHFVIAPDVMEVVARADVQRSIKAMMDAQIARLPFPRLLIEFEIEHGVRRFVLLHEEPTGIRAHVATLHRQAVVTVSPSAPFMDVQPDRLHVSNYSGETEGRVVATAGVVALLMLNTRGIDKTIVEPSPKLNRARAKRDKSPIPRYSVVRIGTIYDRGGRATDIADHKRRSMPVHLRAGHTRMQAHGPEWSLRHPVYIPPVLVNYSEGTGVPLPKRLVRV